MKSSSLSPGWPYTVRNKTWQCLVKCLVKYVLYQVLTSFRIITVCIMTLITYDLWLNQSPLRLLLCVFEYFITRWQTPQTALLNTILFFLHIEGMYRNYTVSVESQRASDPRFSSMLVQHFGHFRWIESRLSRGQTSDKCCSSSLLCNLLILFSTFHTE